MGVINSHLGSVDLTGNIGLQAVHTDQSSTGFVSPANDGVTLTQSTKGRKYWEILPSTNLALRFPNDFVIRFAASIQHMAPRLPDMANDFNYFTDTSLGGIIHANGHNPLLKPYQAKALDLNFEKYFGTKGYIALQTFYKHMDRYIASGFIPFDFSGYPPPSNLPPVSNQGILYTQANTKGGYIYGAELAGTLPFEVFSPVLSGFGLTGGLGYTKTKVRDLNGQWTQVPGYSKWVGSLTASKVTDLASVAACVTGRAIWATSRSTAAVSIGSQCWRRRLMTPRLDMTSPIHPLRGACRFISRGKNLTNEPSRTTPNSPVSSVQFLKYQSYGRTFLAGFTYKLAASPPPPPPPPPLPPPPPARSACDADLRGWNGDIGNSGVLSAATSATATAAACRCACTRVLIQAGSPA